MFIKSKWIAYEKDKKLVEEGILAQAKIIEVLGVSTKANKPEFLEITIDEKLNDEIRTREAVDISYLKKDRFCSNIVGNKDLFLLYGYLEF